ncbi:hypothetical protein ACI50E_17010 [Brucella sp. ZJ1_1]|uniref:hypothetical protein n=1 Tax=Brucella sp. ZJ1_1 TaxID=3379097 RepID=UPI0038546FB1
MVEDESYKERLSYIIGRIDALQQILRVTIATMTDEQRDFIVKAAETYAERCEEFAVENDTDPARDKQSAAWDTAQRIKSAMDDWAEDFDETFRS